MAKIQEVMTSEVVSVRASATLQEVARLMRDEDIGDVLVLEDDGSLRGIITDRDIVVRACADGQALDRVRAGDICTADVVMLGPTDDTDEAVRLMRGRAVRRLPVVKGDRPIGIVTIGDLARLLDTRSALADISAAAPNN